MPATTAAAKVRRRKTGSAETGTYSCAEWCRQAGLSKYAFEKLEPKRQPHHVKLSRTSLLVFERPSDWLARIAAEDAQAALAAAAQS
jgi:hypothetical protein